MQTLFQCMSSIIVCCSPSSVKNDPSQAAAEPSVAMEITPSNEERDEEGVFESISSSGVSDRSDKVKAAGVKEVLNVFDFDCEEEMMSAPSGTQSKSLVSSDKPRFGTTVTKRRYTSVGGAFMKGRGLVTKSSRGVGKKSVRGRGKGGGGGRRGRLQKGVDKAEGNGLSVSVLVGANATQDDRETLVSKSPPPLEVRPKVERNNFRTSAKLDHPLDMRSELDQVGQDQSAPGKSAHSSSNASLGHSRGENLVVRGPLSASTEVTPPLVASRLDGNGVVPGENAGSRKRKREVEFGQDEESLCNTDPYAFDEFKGKKLISVSNSRLVAKADSDSNVSTIAASSLKRSMLDTGCKSVRTTSSSTECRKMKPSYARHEVLMESEPEQSSVEWTVDSHSDMLAQIDSMLEGNGNKEDQKKSSQKILPRKYFGHQSKVAHLKKSSSYGSKSKTRNYTYTNCPTVTPASKAEVRVPNITKSASWSYGRGSASADRTPLCPKKGKQVEFLFCFLLFPLFCVNTCWLVLYTLCCS